MDAPENEKEESSDMNAETPLRPEEQPEDDALYQMVIPDGLSEKRYITGMEALNLPAPEDTSGDWHFLNVWYRDRERDIDVVTLAGEGEEINTNPIYGSYGVYRCDEGLKQRGLEMEGASAWAASHFRAILDLLYGQIKKGRYPDWLQEASEDWLDTEEEKKTLLEKAAMMLPHLLPEEQALLIQWINREREPGYRSRQG